MALVFECRQNKQACLLLWGFARMIHPGNRFLMLSVTHVKLNIPRLIMMQAFPLPGNGYRY